ncbi:PH domain-containing protein [Hoyosella sp. G463]|uniref:PH domain-containing protein n=1 Tax=Lolliginicoccus lacisalsi TaxID=2742202 RepID=A0A927JET8_9ACTN|nr:PH domain-containing protein [Lolliginicoccus lacisalsi]
MPNAKPPESQARIIRISRLALLGVLLFACCVALVAATSPRLFGWLLAAPIILAVWILRVQTRVSENGLRTRTMLRTRTVAWEEIKGLTFPKHRSARAVLRSGEQVPLPAVTLEDLPSITPLSNGLIPDIEASYRAEQEETRSPATASPQDSTE